MRVRPARRIEDLPRTLRDQVEVLGEQFFAPFGASGSIIDPSRRKVGAEHERLVMLALSMEGITLNDKLLIFASFEARGWEKVGPGTLRKEFYGNPIELTTDAGFSLLEFSSTPRTEVKDIGIEMVLVMDEAKSILGEKYLLAGGGMLPFTRFTQGGIPDPRLLDGALADKERYNGFVAAIGHAFKFQCLIAADQAQLDIGRGEIVNISNIFTYAAAAMMALFGYSSISEGKPNGYKENRQRLWVHSVSSAPGPNGYMHRGRVGLPRLVTSEWEYFIENLLVHPGMVTVLGGGKFSSNYFYFAETLPMLSHIANGGAKVNPIASGLPCEHITIGVDHLVSHQGQMWYLGRLKPYHDPLRPRGVYEVRVVSAQSEIKASLAFYALCLGLTANQERTLHFFRGLTGLEGDVNTQAVLDNAISSAERYGMNGTFAQRPMVEVLGDIVDIAKRSLEEIGMHENAAHLEILYQWVRDEKSPADHALEAFGSADEKGVRALADLLRVK